MEITANLDELSKVDQRNYVRAAIDRLSEMDGLIISLYYIEESSINEIEEMQPAKTILKL